jgi:23S rRNA pseudouridine1911/1915/1917 synthase
VEARLSYRRLAVHRGFSHVEIALETGRKHQIRVQFADRGHPVLGDRKYGATRPFPQGIALHARRLVFGHPVRDERIEIVAPLPACWRAFGTED